MKFDVPAADLAVFIEVVCGLDQTVTYPGGVSATRRIPLQHPSLIANLWADSLAISLREGVCTQEGVTDPGSIIITDPSPEVTAYTCDVGFHTPPWSLTGDVPEGTPDTPLVTQSATSGVDYVTRPGSAYKYTSDNKRLNRDVPVQITTEELSYTFHRLPFLNEATWLTMTAKVNSDTFLATAPGYLLYLGFSFSGELSLYGRVSYEVTHHFKYRSVPWNQVMREDTGAFDTPVTVSGSNPMYPSAAFSVFFS